MKRENRTLKKSDTMMERALKLEPLQIAPDTFVVASSSEANKGYIVKYSGGRLECNCEGYKYRFECSHLLAVDGLLEKLSCEF
jgi:hypothetical protein